MKKVLYLVAGVMALTACSNEDSPGGESDALVEIRLASSVQGQTRATHGIDQRIAEGETVHVWVDGTTGDEILYEDNAMTVDASGNFTEGEAMYFPVSGNAVDIYAIHGNLSYNSGSFWGSTVNHTVLQDQTSSTGSYATSDLTYGYLTNVLRTASVIELPFKHLLSKVEVVLRQGAWPVEVAKVEICNTMLQAQFTPVKGSDIAVTATGSTGTITIDSDVTAADGEEVVNEAIIAPQTLSSGTLFIRIKPSGGNILTYTLSGETTFEAGKKYRYIFTLNQIGLEVTTEISEWSETETMEISMEKEVTY